jgi:quercetin dioxygenase-like cupin family protein
MGCIGVNSAAMTSQSIYTHPVHLGLGATALSEPPFSGIAWYGDYVVRHASDGAEGRLVSHSTFTESWTSWEMHPLGDEVVICLTGTMTLVQEFPDGKTATVTLAAGDYVINPPGVWHTADIEGEASALFITAGMGTEHRPRD